MSVEPSMDSRVSSSNLEIMLDRKIDNEDVKKALETKANKQ